MIKYSLQRKMLLNSILIVGFAVGMIIIGYIEFVKSNNFSSQILPLTDKMLTLNLIQDLEKTLILNFDQYLITKSESSKELILESIALLIKNHVDIPDDIMLLKEFTGNFNTLSSKPMLDSRTRNDMIAKNYKIHRDLTGMHQKLIDNNLSEIQLMVFKQQESIKNAVVTFLLFGFAMIILYLSMGFRSHYSLTGSILKLKRATTEIISGNYGIITDIQTTNEVSELVNHFNNMAKKIQLDFSLITDQRTKIIEKNIELANEIEEKELSHNELNNLRNLLNNIINSMPSILIGIDSDERIILWNEMATKELGFSLSDSIGEKLFAIFPRISEQMNEIKIAIKERKQQSAEKVKITIGGETKYCNIIIYPLIDNNTNGVVIRIDDATLMYKKELHLQQSQKMESIGNLAGGIAHDFNNILSGIFASAEILKTPKMKLNEKGLIYVDLILRSGQRAAGLTSKLLAFSRKSNMDYAVVDIHSIVDDTLLLLSGTIDKIITISVHKNAGNNTVVGDNSALQNVIMNLCINSSHAMKSGGEIRITTENVNFSRANCNASTFKLKPGNYVDIEVYDNGNGINPEYIDKIFDPFFTTKEQGEGTGLGLSAVYGIVQDHHGAISVYSEIGEGTVFHLYIPCSEITIESPISDKKILPGSGLILLVDDEEIIRIATAEILKDMGYNVITAENGHEAVKIYTEEYSNIDVVIMDMIMPIMNGYETFQKFKEIFPECKVILSSGFTKDAIIEEIKDLSICGYLRKPFESYELNRMLDKILNNSK